MAVTISASEKGLKIIDAARRQKGWTKYEEAWFQRATTSKATLKRFWSKKPVAQKTFVLICEQVGVIDWEAIAASPPTANQTPPALSVYNPETWVGRSSIIAELLPKLQDKTRLVWITGIPGIGKTTLGECLASRAWDENPVFQWIYLEVLERQGADFTTIAADLLGKLGDRELDPQERNDPKRLTDRLIRKLQSSCYWVQLDSLERLLNPEQGTEFADAHWVTFLQRCLTERDFRSQLVLTAQALPSALVEFADRYPNVWAAKTLAGLSANEPQNEHLEFFRKHGVVVDETNQAILSKLGQVYEGHTLVLQVMSGEIQADFAGDAGRYWAVNQQEFEQVARSLAAKRLDETEYNDEFDRRVRDRVKKSLQKLPTDAQDLLLRSSVYRRPVPKKFWLAMIDDRSSSQQKDAYRVLSDRALVEKESTDIRQHNLIRAIAYDLLKQDHSRWKTSERQAADIWFDHQQNYILPKSEFPNLETVRGFLEAFHHYCEIEDWESACKIIAVDIKIRTNEELVSSCQLHVQLARWGNHQETIYLYTRLIEKVDLEVEGQLRLSLGGSYYHLELYEKASKEFEACLRISNKIKANRTKANRIKCQALLGLSKIHAKDNSYSLAIKRTKECMKIAEETKDIEVKIDALETLGNIHFDLEKYVESAGFLEDAYFLSQEFSGPEAKSTVLGNLARTYFFLDRKEEAFKKFNEIRIHQKTGKRSWADAICIAGGFYAKDGNYPQAITFYVDALKIYREIQSLSMEMKTLENIGTCYLSLKNHEMSLDYFCKSLSIAIETKKFQNTEHLLAKLGQVCIALHKYKEALFYNNLHMGLIDNELALRYGIGHGQFLEQNRGGTAVLSETELGMPLAEEYRKLQEEIEIAFRPRWNNLPTFKKPIELA